MGNLSKKETIIWNWKQWWNLCWIHHKKCRITKNCTKYLNHITCWLSSGATTEIGSTYNSRENNNIIMKLNITLNKRLRRKVTSTLEGAIVIHGLEKPIFLKNYFKRNILQISTVSKSKYSVNKYQMFPYREMVNITITILAFMFAVMWQRKQIGF